MRIGHPQVAQERPRQFQVALLLAVVPASPGLAWRRLGQVAAQHRLALLAEFQLHFAGSGEQVGVAKALRQQLGDQCLRLLQRQVAGDVAGLVAVDQLQVHLTLDLHRFGDDPLQRLVGADMARQHQFAQAAVSQGVGQQVEKLSTRVRRAGGGGRGRHREWVPRNAGALGAMAHILR